jgi:hypothetical protein
MSTVDTAPVQVAEPVKVSKYGTKQQVWESSAQMTRGKLTKDDLTLNTRGLACSKKSQERGRALQKQIAEKGPTSSGVPHRVVTNFDQAFQSEQDAVPAPRCTTRGRGRPPKPAAVPQSQ